MGHPPKPRGRRRHWHRQRPCPDYASTRFGLHDDAFNDVVSVLQDAGGHGVEIKLDPCIADHVEGNFLGIGGPDFVAVTSIALHEPLTILLHAIKEIGGDATDDLVSVGIIHQPDTRIVGRGGTPAQVAETLYENGSCTGLGRCGSGDESGCSTSDDNNIRFVNDRDCHGRQFNCLLGSIGHNG